MLHEKLTKIIAVLTELFDNAELENPAMMADLKLIEAVLVKIESPEPTHDQAVAFLMEMKDASEYEEATDEFRANWNEMAIIMLRFVVRYRLMTDGETSLLKRMWPYIYELCQENNHEPNVGIFKDRELEAIADEYERMFPKKP